MKFRLRTLLVLVTACALIVAVILQISIRKEKLRLHQASFEAIDDQVSALDSELEPHLLQMPAVLSQLQAANPIDPPMALSHSITGSSQRFEQYQFERRFHYDWQLADGSRAEGITITIASVIHDDPSEKHLVKLTYAPSQLNTEIASWIAARLGKDKRVQIEHVKLPPLAWDTLGIKRGFHISIEIAEHEAAAL